MDTRVKDVVATRKQPAVPTAAGQSLPHESAALHVSGEAIYTDDIPELRGTLHCALGLSQKAHARFELGDVAEWVRTHPCVVRVVTADDVPGRNLFGTIGLGEGDDGVAHPMEQRERHDAERDERQPDRHVDVARRRPELLRPTDERQQAAPVAEQDVEEERDEDGDVAPGARPAERRRKVREPLVRVLERVLAALRDERDRPGEQERQDEDHRHDDPAGEMRA